MDAKEVLEYLYCVTFSSDLEGDLGGTSGDFWELTRRIVLPNSGPWFWALEGDS
jgi:hypothetical protein